MLKSTELRTLTATNYLWPAFYFCVDWSLVVACAWVSQTLASWPVYLAAVLIIGGRQHALFVLIHEGVHKHLARGKKLNDFTASWLAAYPLLFDMHAYRTTHLKHHEHLNTEQDPDWIRKRPRREWQFPAARKNLAGFIPYFLLVWGPLEWTIIIVLYSGIFERETYRNPLARSRLLRKLIFYSLAAAVITLLGGWSTVLWYWLVPLFVVFPAVQRLRSVAEHFGLPWTHDLNSSRDVLAGPMERSMFSPHYVNFHLSHHLYPAVPCYQLPRLHQRLMEIPDFKTKAHVNSSYLGLGRSVLRDLVTLGPGLSTSPGSTAEPEQITQLKAS